MEELILLKPDESMEDEFLQFNQEWEEHMEKMVPYAADLRGMSFEDWLKESRQLEHDAPDGMVTASLWLLLRENRILGAIALRHELNDYLMSAGGHIGYGIRPSERGRGLADIMLKKALLIVKEMNYQKVLVTCSKNNIPSEKTIIKNGGILENEIVYGEEIVARYWIHL